MQCIAINWKFFYVLLQHTALRLVQTSLIWLRICSWLRQRCLFFSKNCRPLQKRTNGNFSNFSQLNMQTVNKTTRFIESDLDWDNDVQNFVSINLESKLLRVLKLHRFGTDFSFQSQNILSLTFRWTAIKVHDDGRYVNVLFCHGSAPGTSGQTYFGHSQLILVLFQTRQDSTCLVSSRQDEVLPMVLSLTNVNKYHVVL